MRLLRAHYAPTMCFSLCGGKLMAHRCGHNAPLVRSLCAHSVFQVVWVEIDSPYMRPLCAYCVRPIQAVRVLLDIACCLFSPTHEGRTTAQHCKPSLPSLATSLLHKSKHDHHTLETYQYHCSQQPAQTSHSSKSFLWEIFRMVKK